MVGWIVPLGISFTVFRLIGILMDSATLKSPVSVQHLLFLALFFPTFRSGPITTLNSVHPLTDQSIRIDEQRSAWERILLGLFRKVALADMLQTLVISPWLAAGVSHLSPTQCLILPILFGLHIYSDFSGYSDIAIGMAALLGYRINENFDRPYISGNLVEFWRRWHISLSEWIRLRLFMKLVGRRSPKWQMYGATFLSMTLCGIWHGAATNLVLWGMWHGLGLILVHLYGELRRRSDWIRGLGNLPGVALVSTALTFSFVTVGWIFFSLPINDAALLISRILLWRPDTAGNFYLIATLACLFVGWWISSRSAADRIKIPSLIRQIVLSVISAAVIYLLIFHQKSSQEFLYTQF